MKILIVAPLSQVFPTGIAYVSAAIKNAGHVVKCLNYKDEVGLRKIISDNDFDVVATGGLSSQYNSISKIISIARQNRNVKIILGGGIVTSEPELLTSDLKPDFSVIGEGEITTVELLRCIENSGDIENIHGIAFLKEGQYIQTAWRREIEDLDSLKFPDYESFNYSKILDEMKPSDQFHYDVFDYPREYQIVTSRSCPFHCTFCYHPSGQKYRQRSMDSIFHELGKVIPRYKINIVSIVDELFSYNQERLYDFCNRFKELVRQYDWKVLWGCQMRVSGLKEEVLDALKESGCIGLSYGFESYSPTVLKSMKKHITPQQIHHAIHATLERRISIQGNFIFGDKAETLETAKETLDFWKEHAEAGILLGYIIACPDSEMYQHACRTGVIKDRLDFIKNHLFDVYNMTQMSDSEFLRLRAMVSKYYYQYSPFVVPISEDKHRVTIRCPHCRETVTYTNFTRQRQFEPKLMYCRACRKRIFKIGRIGFLFSRFLAMAVTPSTYSLFKKGNDFRIRLTKKLSTPAGY